MIHNAAEAKYSASATLCVAAVELACYTNAPEQCAIWRRKQPIPLSRGVFQTWWRDMKTTISRLPERRRQLTYSSKIAAPAQKNKCPKVKK
jgi:hypothetical protein